MMNFLIYCLLLYGNLLYRVHLLNDGVSFLKKREATFSFKLDVLRETLPTKQDGHNWRILIDKRGEMKEKKDLIFFSPSFFFLCVSKFD